MTEQSRDDKMQSILDRIPEHWGKYLPMPGWDDLLLALDRRLAQIDPGYEINQAKEKFGTLRFYTTFSDDFAGDNTEWYRLIGEAEAASAFICEMCGQKGKTRQLGWIKTLCDEHAKKEGKA